MPTATLTATEGVRRTAAADLHHLDLDELDAAIASRRRNSPQTVRHVFLMLHRCGDHGLHSGQIALRMGVTRNTAGNLLSQNEDLFEMTGREDRKFRYWRTRELS